MRTEKPLIALIVILLATDSTFACPLCKDSVSTEQPGTQSAESASLDFNTSIYAMLAGVAGVAGFTGVAIFKAIGSQRR